MANTSVEETPGSVRAAMVAVRDTQLYVEDTGEGPALLFIHGMCGDAHVWSGQVQRLADRFRCLSYDRRGHSRSPRGDAQESVETHAEDAATLIETLGIQPIVVGSSGGARIGVELIRRHPGLVLGAVLSEPPIPSLVPDTSLMSEVAAVVKPAMANGGPRAAVDAFFGFACPGLWSRLDEAAREPYRANAAMMLAELASPPYELHPIDLGAISVPTVVIHGDRSHPAFPAIARILAVGFPNAKLRKLDGSGHVTYAERPDEFAQIITDFVTSMSQTQSTAPVPAGVPSRPAPKPYRSTTRPVR
jgi:pimeloyl-ACP methyl ester carboxylesterase